MRTRDFLVPFACALLAGCASAGPFPKAPDGPHAADYALLQAENFNDTYSEEVRGLKNSGADRAWLSGDYDVTFVLNKGTAKATARHGGEYFLIGAGDEFFAQAAAQRGRGR